jgi:hypothetical protein
MRTQTQAANEAVAIFESHPLAGVTPFTWQMGDNARRLLRMPLALHIALRPAGRSGMLRDHTPAEPGWSRAYRPMNSVIFPSQ